MSDELTPEERKALDGLPRERMPAGLEDRVVGAMREHGFLEKRRRMIVLSNARVAGLVAACMALVIGAYSVGLNRGNRAGVIPMAETLLREKSEQASPRVPTGKDNAFRDEDLAASEAPREDVVASPPARQMADVPEPAVTDEARHDLPAPGGYVESKEKLEAPVPAVSTDLGKSAPAAGVPALAEKKAVPAAALNESAARSRVQQDLAGPGLATLTFMVNGSPVVVEFPDSLRVEQGPDGRILLIYTSDGVIRIQLGDER
ncbi:MAG TPA: hypothetical protein VFX92_03960 [Candidatus Krumholzibacteria bacterium]|nr:hypothetical protein [Candidatus Krumholzibacteria bacterium]